MKRIINYIFELLATCAGFPKEHEIYCWRSIESGPKDGSRVLVVNDGQVMIGWFDNEYKDAWQKDPIGTTIIHPTHWMPLPGYMPLPSPEMLKERGL